MRWTPGGSRENIEDRRGESGGGGGFRFGGGGLGLGGLIILVILSIVFKTDLTGLLGGGGIAGGGTPATAPAGPVESTAEEERQVEFVTFVLNDADSVWTITLPGVGTQYRDPKLVLFRDGIQSACGYAESASGPFYCPGDEKVYIDLGFFDELRSRFGAPGEFAQAYVLAHEIGHHVQNILGTEAQMRRAQKARPELANELSVRMELQADCYAGVWGNAAQKHGLLEPGDVEQGLAAAAAVGDDRIQRMSGTRVNPESWTHGSSEQRVAWFKRGMASGKVEDCDTFSTRN